MKCYWLLVAILLVPATALRASFTASITSPTGNENFSSPPVSASFSAADNTSGRYIVSLTATLDGASVSFSSGPSGLGSQSVTASASLNPSNSTYSHTLTVVAQDQFGTQATQSITFTVEQSQAAVTCSNATANSNSTWSPPTISGGSGTGGYQWCLGGVTNWDGGTSSHTGTNLGTSQSPNWSSTCTTENGGGPYTFWVIRDGDSTYAPSAAQSYTLTLNAPTPGITFGSMNGYGSNYSFIGNAGSTGSFSGSATNSGTSIWNSNYYMLLYNQSGSVVCFVPTGNVNPGGQTTGTFSFTVPSTPGQYSYCFGGLEQNVEYFGPNPTLTVTSIGSQNLSISPSSQTVYLGQSSSASLSASGSANGVYEWSSSGGGSFSPSTGSSTTFSYSSPGTITITAASPAITYYYAGSTTATVTFVSGYPPPVVTYGNPSGTYAAGFSYQVSASNYPNSFSASNLPPGLSINNSGVISGTPTAAGSYAATVYAYNSNGSGSNTIYITIGQAAQSTVSIQPSAALNAANGQAITFSATGGSSTGNYVWGGAASGTGSMVTVSFSQNGQQSVTVYRASDSNYLQSNTASTTVTVTAPVQDTNNSTQLNVLVPTSTP